MPEKKPSPAQPTPSKKPALSKAPALPTPKTMPSSPSTTANKGNLQQPVKPYGYGKSTPSAPFDKQRSGEATNYNLSNRASNPGTLKTVGEQQAYDKWTSTDSKGMLHTVPLQGPSADKYAGNTVSIPWSSVEGGKSHLGPSGKYAGVAGNGFKAPSGIPGVSNSNMNGHKAVGVPNRAASRAQF